MATSAAARRRVEGRGRKDVRHRIRRKRIFVVDYHAHVWDARPQNRRNHYGQTFIDTFYGAHVGLTPPNQRWERERFDYYGAEGAAGTCSSTAIATWPSCCRSISATSTSNGFNTTELGAGRSKSSIRSKVILNGRCDPREGAEGSGPARGGLREIPAQRSKLYTSEWNGASRGYSLKDRFRRSLLEACQRLGIRNIHVHKGPRTHPAGLRRVRCPRRLRRRDGLSRPELHRRSLRYCRASTISASSPARSRTSMAASPLSLRTSMRGRNTSPG